MNENRANENRANENRLDAALNAALAKRQAAQALRTPVVSRGFLERDNIGTVSRNGKALTDLSSNDYLGLSTHPFLRQRAAEWAAYGVGAGASRLVTGTFDLHARVEEKIAAFKSSEAALLFATGWQANASVLPALDRLSRQETGHPAHIFMDKLNHASLHQGCAAAGVRQHRFRHNDLAHLRHLLGLGDGVPDSETGLEFPGLKFPGLKFIVTESVFSMDGDRANLPALRQIADEAGAFLYVDEAHATGILGPNGRGLAHGLADLTMSTASKALGGMGAFVTGSKALCAWLFNQASGLVYSTALPPPVLGALDAALDLVPSMNEERAQVAAQAERLREGLKVNGWACGESSTQIVPVMVGENATALGLAAALEEEGFLALPIRPPTVPPGTARLRLALHAGLSEASLDKLIRVFQRHTPPARSLKQTAPS